MEYIEKVWCEDFIGQLLCVWLFLLFDNFLVLCYQEVVRDVYVFKFICLVFEIYSWFDCSYLNVVFKEFKLEGYWFVYGVDGQFL